MQNPETSKSKEATLAVQGEEAKKQKSGEATATRKETTAQIVVDAWQFFLMP